MRAKLEISRQLRPCVGNAITPMSWTFYLLNSHILKTILK